MITTTTPEEIDKFQRQIVICQICLDEIAIDTCPSCGCPLCFECYGTHVKKANLN